MRRSVPKSLACAAGVLALGLCARAGEVVWLDTLELTPIRQITGSPQANLSTVGTPLSLATRAFKRGVGTHANSFFFVDLKGGATRFSAWVGVDDAAGDAASVNFRVLGDGKVLFESGLMHVGDQPKEVALDVAGVKTLALLALDCDDGDKEDKADWADALFEVAGEKPVTIPVPAAAKVGVLTPPVSPEPRIAGPRVFGVRPGSPFLFAIPATGKRPMTFAGRGLPAGLALDGQTGRITGKLSEKGEFKIVLCARNDAGEARRELRVVCGERLALTPPLGWTTRPAENLSQQMVKDAADALVATGLVQHGWCYVNVDDGWQGTRPPPAYALQPNERFPDLPGLCQYLHDQGLKLGLYSTPWRMSYQGCTGGSADDEKGGFAERGRTFGRVSFHQQDARQFGAWGVDCLKYEWCPMDVEHAKAMSEALKGLPRDVVFSLAHSAPLENAKQWAELAQSWRTGDESLDRWARIAAAGFGQEPWREESRPGHWNDLGALVLDAGGPDFHPNAGLTENEQYAHISLWCLNASPLMLSGDPAKWKNAEDPRVQFLLGLLTNDEVLDVNQDPLGQQARRAKAADETEVWVKDLEDGTKAVGLFNRGDFGAATVKVTWEELGIKGQQVVRDLWRQKDLGEADGQFEAEVNSHGVVLVRIRPAK